MDILAPHETHLPTYHIGPDNLLQLCLALEDFISPWDLHGHHIRMKYLCAATDTHTVTSLTNLAS